MKHSYIRAIKIPSFEQKLYEKLTFRTLTREFVSVVFKNTALRLPGRSSENDRGCSHLLENKDKLGISALRNNTIGLNH